jgi:hypothetical protein
MTLIKNNGLHIVSIIILISLLVVFGPILIIWSTNWVLEHFFFLDCHSNAGGSFPFPTTSCGRALFILTGVYYIWFVTPVPLVIPVAVIVLLSRHYILKFKSKSLVRSEQ